MKIKVGDIISAFDSKLWVNNGGDSKTDTFFRKAKVLSIHWNTATIQFEHDNRISKGHYISDLVLVRKGDK